MTSRRVRRPVPPSGSRAGRRERAAGADRERARGCAQARAGPGTRSGPSREAQPGRQCLPISEMLAGTRGGGACWGRESPAPAHHEAGPGRALGLPGPQEPARLVCTRGQGQGAFGAAEVRGRAGPRGLGVPGRSRGLGGGPGTVVSSGVAPACPDPARAAARHLGTPSARRLAPRGKPSLRRRVDGSGREDAPDIWNELSAI